MAKKTTAKKSTAKKTAKKSAKAKAGTRNSKSAKKKLDSLNETGERKKTDRRVEDSPVENERRKNHRRRQIDPTTCEREYSDQEIQFMQAMDEYKRLSGRMFPTCSEILEVLHKIGYRQIADVVEIYNPDTCDNKTGENFHEELEDIS